MSESEYVRPIQQGQYSVGVWPKKWLECSLLRLDGVNRIFLKSDSSDRKFHPGSQYMLVGTLPRLHRSHYLSWQFHRLPKYLGAHPSKSVRAPTTV